jgi:hypothetical protein
MKHKKIEEHIDNSILKKLGNGSTLNEVNDYFTSVCNKFKTRDSYLSVSKNELLAKWDSFEIKSKYITYYVMHVSKRINDIYWIIENKDRLPKFNDAKLFKLIKFKEELRKIKK